MGRCGEQRGAASLADSYHAASPLDSRARRYLGLSLGGAKSDRTCLVVLDYYGDQGKTFVIEVFESISSQGDETADEVLLEIIKEMSSDPKTPRMMGVDAPLTLPPCLPACDSVCISYEKCKRPAVKWMRTHHAREKMKNRRVKHFTPYSQRPVDLFFRYQHPEQNLFQDETMGANLAPQAVRMNYLKPRFSDLKLVEVWPKLALYACQKALKMNKREILEYRHMERGAAIRQRLIERLMDKFDVFIYERDLKKFLANVACFDAFICAWVSLQCDLERVVKFKSDLPLDSGWVQVPDL